MGFFSDLKDDLSQAVNELMPEEEIGAATADDNKSEGSDAKKPQGGIITSEELSDMLDKVEAMSAENEASVSDEDTSVEAEVSAVLDEAAVIETPQEELPDEAALADAVPEEIPDEAAILAALQEEVANETELLTEQPEEPYVEAAIAEAVPEEIPDEAVILAALQEETQEDASAAAETEVQLPEEAEATEDTTSEEPGGIINDIREEVQESVKEEVKEEAMEAEEVSQEKEGEDKKMDFQPKVVSDETAVVTEGMSIVGDITSGGSLELLGSVTGNIDVLGKLNVTGSVQGNSKAAEIFAEGARINGEINSQGSVKIGQSSVIIGNIFANSAVIAGAVKGDIDVHGPVVLDTSAIVMGNIKSKSVQINNGAVIEGMCSQCYAEVNPTSFFEEIKKKKDNKEK